MTIGTSYNLFMLILVPIVSNGLTAIVMFYLFKRLLVYYKFHYQNAILSYAISGFIISITALVTIFFHGSYIVIET